MRCHALFKSKGTFSDEWDKVSHYLNTNKYIGNKEAREILHLGDTVKVSRLFNRWVKQGLLTKIVPRTGAKKSVRYRLPAADEKLYLL